MPISYACFSGNITDTHSSHYLFTQSRITGPRGSERVTLPATFRSTGNVGDAFERLSLYSPPGALSREDGQRYLYPGRPVESMNAYPDSRYSQPPSGSVGNMLGGPFTHSKLIHHTNKPLSVPGDGGDSDLPK